jgi:non-ribosomal peptide synthetase component F
MKPRNFLRLALVGTLVAGCASKSADIAASYVSPMQYQDLSCSQLTQEAQRVSARVAQVSARQDKKASSDGAAMAVGMVLFWPALFLLEGDEESASEVARLKGEMEAIEQANIQKNCGIQLG